MHKQSKFDTLFEALMKGIKVSTRLPKGAKTKDVLMGKPLAVSMSKETDASLRDSTDPKKKKQMKMKRETWTVDGDKVDSTEAEVDADAYEQMKRIMKLLKDANKA